MLLDLFDVIVNFAQISNRFAEFVAKILANRLFNEITGFDIGEKPVF